MAWATTGCAASRSAIRRVRRASWAPVMGLAVFFFDDPYEMEGSE